MRVLVGYDGSDGATQPVAFVASAAWPKNSIVRVVSVVEPAVMPMHESGTDGAFDAAMAARAGTGNDAAKTGKDVDLPLQPFGELESNLRAQVDRIRAHPWINDVPVHGLIYEVETGRLREVA
jgi:hypothetical protein